MFCYNKSVQWEATEVGAKERRLWLMRDYRVKGGEMNVECWGLNVLPASLDLVLTQKTQTWLYRSKGLMNKQGLMGWLFFSSKKIIIMLIFTVLHVIPNLNDLKEHTPKNKAQRMNIKSILHHYMSHQVKWKKRTRGGESITAVYKQHWKLIFDSRRN